MACYLFPGKTIRRFDQKKQIKTGLKVVGNYSSKVVQIIPKQKAFDSFFRQKKRDCFSILTRPLWVQISDPTPVIWPPFQVLA